MSKKNPTIIAVVKPDRGAGDDPKFYFIFIFIYLFTFFFFFFFFFGGGGGELVFHHQGSTFLQWAYLSNDLPQPRRYVLFECF